MDEHADPLMEQALALVSAAEHFARAAEDRSCATHLPAALACVEQSLHALGRGCRNAGASLIPAGDRGESVCDRYARAARDWPGAPSGVGPSYERQAQLLASMHDADTRLHAAAASCGRAKDVLLATMDTSTAADKARELKVTARAA